MPVTVATVAAGVETGKELGFEVTPIEDGGPAFSLSSCESGAGDDESGRPIGSDDGNGTRKRGPGSRDDGGHRICGTGN